MSDQPIPYKRTLLLDDNGDLQFDGAGRLVMTQTNVEKQNQDIRIYMKTILGEDIFNTSLGFDLYSAKAQPFSNARLDYEIRRTLEQYRTRENRPNRIKSINSIEVGDPDIERAVEVVISLTADTNAVTSLEVDI